MVTGYQLWLGALGKQYLDEYHQGPPLKTFGARMKYLGKMWRDLPEIWKHEWHNLAELKNELHKRRTRGIN
jgi:hypothetical protein